MADITSLPSEDAVTQKTSFDINEIIRLLPHRYPYLLIDRVIDLTPGKQIVAIKNVTVNEPFFQGHFPNVPVMPGVLVIEAMVQASAVLLLQGQEERDSKAILLSGIDRAKFRRRVIPGDQLRIEVEVDANRGVIKGFAYVDGNVAAEASFHCRLVDRSPAGAPENQTESGT